LRLVADEGVDKPIVDHLRTLGHEVIYVAEESYGIPDIEVLELSRKKKAPLVTLDTDFGELVYRLKEVTHGVLLLRIAGLSREEKLHIVESVLTHHSHEIEGSFTVVTKNSIRIRKL
jgi:predicted nuclease of predicted toxin-antitoxin system